MSFFQELLDASGHFFLVLICFFLYVSLLIGCFLFARYVMGPYVLGPIFKLFFKEDE